MLPGAWLYSVHRTCAETEAVSCGSSHVRTKQRIRHLADIFKTCCVKAAVTHSELHTTRAQWVCSEAENSAIVFIVKRLGLISRWDAGQVKCSYAIWQGNVLIQWTQTVPSDRDMCLYNELKLYPLTGKCVYTMNSTNCTHWQGHVLIQWTQQTAPTDRKMC